MSESILLDKENEIVKIKDIDPSSCWNLNEPYNHYKEDDDDDSSIDYGIESEEIVCGCGKPLSAGWTCTQCRYNCSTCHRALISGEICSRCHVKRSTS